MIERRLPRFERFGSRRPFASAFVAAVVAWFNSVSSEYVLAATSGDEVLFAKHVQTMKPWTST